MRVRIADFGLWIGEETICDEFTPPRQWLLSGSCGTCRNLARKCSAENAAHAAANPHPCDKEFTAVQNSGVVLYLDLCVYHTYTLSLPMVWICAAISSGKASDL